MLSLHQSCLFQLLFRQHMISQGLLIKELNAHCSLQSCLFQLPFKLSTHIINGYLFTIYDTFTFHYAVQLGSVFLAQQYGIVHYVVSLIYGLKVEYYIALTMCLHGLLSNYAGPLQPQLSYIFSGEPVGGAYP